MLVELRKYAPSGVTFDFVDRAETYDISIFKVIEPQPYEDWEFTLLHLNEPAEGSPWRSKGGRLWLMVDEVILIDQSNIFPTSHVEIVGQATSLPN